MLECQLVLKVLTELIVQCSILAVFKKQSNVKFDHVYNTIHGKMNWSDLGASLNILRSLAPLGVGG
jgi:hypothetical protein